LVGIDAVATKQFLWIFRLLGYDVWKSFGYSPIDPACYRGEATHEKARNKIADKLLETLDLAKSLDFAANDFKRLRPGSRSLFFRLAQPSLRLRRLDGSKRNTSAIRWETAPLGRLVA